MCHIQCFIWKSGGPGTQRGCQGERKVICMHHVRRNIGQHTQCFFTYSINQELEDQLVTDENTKILILVYNLSSLVINSRGDFCGILLKIHNNFLGFQYIDTQEEVFSQSMNSSL